MISKQHVLLPTFSTIGVTEESESQIVLVRINFSPDEYEKQSDSVKKILSLTRQERKEVERYTHMDENTKKIIQAFVEANNALCLGDTSEIVSLWNICTILNPDVKRNDFKPMYIKPNQL